MIHFLNLVLIFAFALQSAFALECYLNGECTDSNYVGAQRAKDMNQCISICQDTSKNKRDVSYDLLDMNDGGHLEYLKI